MGRKRRIVERELTLKHECNTEEHTGSERRIHSLPSSLHVRNSLQQSCPLSRVFCFFSVLSLSLPSPGKCNLDLRAKSEGRERESQTDRHATTECERKVDTRDNCECCTSLPHSPASLLLSFKRLLTIFSSLSTFQNSFSSFFTVK